MAVTPPNSDPSPVDAFFTKAKEVVKPALSMSAANIKKMNL